MPGSGSTTLNFGSFPGATETSVAVTGQGSIISGSIIGAWIRATGSTADHTSDEHRIENLKIVAGDIVASTGFTIYGEVEDGTMLYGSYNIDWVWS